MAEGFEHPTLSDPLSEVFAAAQLFGMSPDEVLAMNAETYQGYLMWLQGYKRGQRVR